MTIYLDWEDMIGKLRAVVLELEGRLLRREIEMIWELIDAREPAVAYEMLCSQLYEHDAGIQTQTIGVLAELGSAMNLEPRKWQILRVID
jgi:hypothetical protein